MAKHELERNLEYIEGPLDLNGVFSAAISLTTLGERRADFRPVI